VTALIVAVFVPMGISWAWGLIAPPTKVEKDETVHLKNIETSVTDIRSLLEHQNTHPHALQQFVDERGWEQKYSLGFALFYSNGSKTLHYGKQPNPDISFDPSSIKIIHITNYEVSFVGMALKLRAQYLMILEVS
jgi:hypothetical protein